MPLLTSRPIRGLVIGLLIPVLAVGCFWEELLPWSGRVQDVHQQESPTAAAYRSHNDVLRQEAVHTMERLFEHYRSQAPRFADSMNQLDVRWGLFWRWAADAACAQRRPDEASLRTRYLTDLFQNRVVDETMLHLDLRQVLGEFATAMELNAAAYFGELAQTEAFVGFREQWRQHLRETALELAATMKAVAIAGDRFGGGVMGPMALDLAVDAAWYGALMASLLTPLKIAAPLLLAATALRILNGSSGQQARAYRDTAEEAAVQAVNRLESLLVAGTAEGPGLIGVLKDAQTDFEAAVLAFHSGKS